MTPALHFTHFGNYEIIRKLGRSVSDVYLALDPQANRRVVLKIIEHCHDSYTELMVDAERRGATIQQQLHNTDPRILEIFDYGERDGCFFVAMEYAEGHSLAEMIRDKSRLETNDAARYAAEICSQLSSLHSFQIDIDGHRRAVVHGDVKPSNVQIGADAQVRLLDFGIAKAITATRSMTRHNLGSPAYCSPERLKNGQVNPHSDLWAAGVCLYEMLAGIPPYQAETTRKLDTLIQSRRPPRALPNTCPPSLRAVVWKALAADPERRYASAAAFESDLRAFLQGKPTAAEAENLPSWDANATVQGPQAHNATTERRVPAWWERIRISVETELVVWSLLAGLLVGFFWFVGSRFWKSTAMLRSRSSYANASVEDIDRDFKSLAAVRSSYAWMGRLSPVGPLSESIQAKLIAAGDDILDAYRNGPLQNSDSLNWEKARACFAHACDLKPGDAELKAKLAVVKGYAALKHDARAAQARFEEAARYAPKLADPHIGLARIALTQFHNLGQGAAELRMAERLGYLAGPRESEEQADALLFRAEQTMRNLAKVPEGPTRQRQVASAHRDLERARDLYEPLSGFSNVDSSLERVEHDKQLLDETGAAPRPPVVRRAKHKVRRWR